MPDREYRDVPEFGLHFVPSEDHRFRALVHDIEQNPQPFASWQIDDLTNAAVLLNESGKAIVVLSFAWRYTMANGTSRSSRYANLGSSLQMDILNGRVAVPQDLGTCILAGSKRLITEQGMVGNNLDVLTEEQARHGRSYCGAGGGGGARSGVDEQIASIELSLDVAIFDDGLCVGPDTAGMVSSITESLELQRAKAEDFGAAIRNGASAGKVFEMLLPLARRLRPGSTERHEQVLLPMFARMAIDQLINADPPNQLAWFERLARPSALKLHRPS